jgi:hypothetical protein
MEDTMFCSLNIQDTVNLIQHAVVDGSITGECIDSYCVSAKNGGTCAVLVYEKHYYRAGNRLTLTVVVDDFTGRTRVHCASGGGGEGLFRFDWGASESFSAVVADALAKYRI